MTMLQERVRIKAHKEPPQFSRSPVIEADELVNAVTHGVGLMLSIAGAILLIAGAYVRGDAYRVAGCAIYATTLIAVYAASTLSHSPANPRLRQWLRSLDQATIYLLIVGTCMPFALTYLRSGWWFLFFALMWTVALCGFASKMLFSHRVDSVAVWIYVLLGWMPILTVPALVNAIPATPLWWMLIGGLFYTCGTLFLVRDDRHRYFHAVWHVFVMAGSTCHFLAILIFVGNLPAGT
jgi:hemolysin III